MADAFFQRCSTARRKIKYASRNPPKDIHSKILNQNIKTFQLVLSSSYSMNLKLDQTIGLPQFGTTLSLVVKIRSFS